MKLVWLKEGEEELTLEECKAATRPTDAGDYWKEWDAFYVAQCLFVDEIAFINSGSLDKKDKKSFGNHMVAIWEWFKRLPESKLDEGKKVADKWNFKGAPNKKEMQVWVSFSYIWRAFW